MLKKKCGIYINIQVCFPPFFSVVPLFIMGSPFEFILGFKCFYLCQYWSDIYCCVGLTIDCRKSPSRKKILQKQSQ